jgi:hypothetical protein
MDAVSVPVKFENCVFKGKVNFAATEFLHELEFSDSRFDSEVKAESMHIHGDFSSQGCHFRRQAGCRFGVQKLTEILHSQALLILRVALSALISSLITSISMAKRKLLISPLVTLQRFSSFVIQLFPDLPGGIT